MSETTVVLAVLGALVVVLAATLVVVSARSRSAAPLYVQADVHPEDEPLASDAAELVDESQVEEIEQERPVPASAGKRNMVTALIVGVLVVAAVIVATQTTKPTVAGAAISQTFETGQACVTVSVPVVAADKADSQDTADALFSALTQLKGLKTATYDAELSSISVGFCETSTTEDAIRQAIAAAGLLAQ